MASVKANLGAQISGLFNPSLRTKSHFKKAFGNSKQSMSGPQIMGPPTASQSAAGSAKLTMGGRGKSLMRGSADYMWRQASGKQRAARAGGIIGAGVAIDGLRGGYND